MRIFVRGGFADVNADGLTILAEQAIPLDDVDAAMLAQEVKNAEEDVADAKDAATKATAESGCISSRKSKSRWARSPSAPNRREFTANGYAPDPDPRRVDRPDRLRYSSDHGRSGQLLPGLGGGGGDAAVAVASQQAAKSADAFAASRRTAPRLAPCRARPTLGASPLLDAVFNVDAVKIAPLSSADLGALAAWSSAGLKAGAVYILAGTGTTDIPTAAKDPKAIERIDVNTGDLCSLSIGRYMDGQIILQGAVAEVVAADPSASKNGPSTKCARGSRRRSRGSSRRCRSPASTMPGARLAWRCSPQLPRSSASCFSARNAPACAPHRTRPALRSAIKRPKTSSRRSIARLLAEVARGAFAFDVPVSQWLRGMMIR